MNFNSRHPTTAFTRVLLALFRMSLIFFLCSFVHSFPQADKQMRAVVPPSYGYLTIAASGHTFKFLNIAPVFGKDGKRLALGLAYINESGDAKSLHGAASELFEHVRPWAEAQNEQALAIIAYTSFDPTQAVNESRTYHIVYERDPVAEKDALADAQAWLALLDAGNYTGAWEVASPLLKGLDAKERWETGARATAGALGRLLSRKKRSTLSTRFVPGAPPGSYVLFEFFSHFSNKLLLKPWPRCSLTMANGELLGTTSNIRDRLGALSMGLISQTVARERLIGDRFRPAERVRPRQAPFRGMKEQGDGARPEMGIRQIDDVDYTAG